MLLEFSLAEKKAKKNPEVTSTILYNLWNDRKLGYLQDKANSRETEYVSTLPYYQRLKTRELLVLCFSHPPAGEKYYTKVSQDLGEKGMKLLVEPNIIAAMLS